jgi:hypothetical protein
MGEVEKKNSEINDVVCRHDDVTAFQRGHRHSRMLPAGRRCGSEWIQRYCVVFTCLTAGLLTARVSADLPFDLHSDPCGTWPDLDIDAPCTCDVSLKSGRDAAEKGNMVKVLVTSKWAFL